MAVYEARAKVGAVQIVEGHRNDPKSFAQFQEAQAGMSSAL